MVTQRPVLLVHGNWGGAWSWDGLRPAMATRGYNIFTIDLEWHRKETGRVPSVADHALQIVDLIRSHKLTDVVLIGHSYGGVPVLQAAADIPDKVSAAVFINAHILHNGENIAQQVPASLMELIGREASNTGGYWLREVLPYESAKQALFPYMTDPEAQGMYANLHPDPLSLWTETLKLPAISEPLPCHYLLFTDDQAIRPGYWRDMACKLSQVHRTEVYELPGSHFGFLQYPQAVVDTLDKALA